MAEIEKVSGVAAADIQAISGVAGTSVEKVSGVELVTFTPQTYNFDSTDSSWAIPGGTNHMDITVIGGGGSGSQRTNISPAGFGGGGAGVAQATENTCLLYTSDAADE